MILRNTYKSSNLPETYTPEEVAAMLKVTKQTVYDLIGRGELVAKKFGKVLRINKASLAFVFEGMDADILEAERIDEKNLPLINSAIKEVRRG